MKQNVMHSLEQNNGRRAADDAPEGTPPVANVHARNWDRNYAQLEAFYQSHGHCRVSRSGEEFRKLAFWLSAQCWLARRGRLLAGRREKLERLPVVFFTHRENWEEKFAALRQFHAGHGHLKVPRDTREMLALGSWLANQTKRHREGALTAERRGQLRQLGWKPRPKSRRRHNGKLRPWNHERMFAALAAFKSRFGHCRVPNAWPMNLRLAGWLAYQRYLGRRQSLALELRERLLQLGVVFCETQVQRWEKMFGVLGDYVSRFGDWRVPPRWPENPALSSWTREMWRTGRDGRLDPERRRRLAALGMDFDHDWPRFPSVVSDRQWEKDFELLQEFRAGHGHCRVPCHWPENPRLARWLGLQLKYWRAGSLKAGRWKRLASLGIDPTLDRGTPKSAADILLESSAGSLLARVAC